MKAVQKIITAINKAQKIMKIVFCVSEILESTTQIINKHFPQDVNENNSDNK